MAANEAKPEARSTPAASAAVINGALPPALMQWNSFILWRTFQQVVEELLNALVPTGYRMAHTSILTLLAEGPLSQIALSTRLNTDRTTMVSLIDELEAQELVERRRNLGDRRIYDVTLTDKGREVLAQLQAIITATDKAFFAPLSGEQQHQLRELLLRLIRPNSTQPENGPESSE